VSSSKMNDVNRMAIVLRPKEPYFAWARSLEADSPIELRTDSEVAKVFLVDQRGDGQDLEKLLHRYYPAIFAEYLYRWWHAEEVWPKQRTWAVFQEWFEVRMVELVIDMSDQPLSVYDG
jgi:hypothetical protein